MGSGNAATTATEPAGTRSENKAPRQRGRAPTPLPDRYAAVLDAHAVALGRAVLTTEARRTYSSRGRVYPAWLAGSDVDGDPLTDPDAAAWAARDYKAHLHGALKRAPATVNAALAAVFDLALRRGLGKLDGTTVARLDLPARRVPKALVGRDDTRWQRAAQAAAPRDRAPRGDALRRRPALPSTAEGAAMAASRLGPAVVKTANVAAGSMAGPSKERRP